MAIKQKKKKKKEKKKKHETKRKRRKKRIKRRRRRRRTATTVTTTTTTNFAVQRASKTKIKINRFRSLWRLCSLEDPHKHIDTQKHSERDTLNFGSRIFLAGIYVLRIFMHAVVEWVNIPHSLLLLNRLSKIHISKYRMWRPCAFVYMCVKWSEKMRMKKEIENDDDEFHIFRLKHNWKCFIGDRYTQTVLPSHVIWPEKTETKERKSKNGNP